MDVPFTLQLESQIDQYFSSVTQDELNADLAAANFDFYNSIGRSVFVTRSLGAFAIPQPLIAASNHTVPVCSPVAGAFEEMPLAA